MRDSDAIHILKRIIEFLGPCAAAWLTVVCVRFAGDFAQSPWWFAWVAAACVFGLPALVLSAYWVAIAVRPRA